jgi:hypothetical protein
MMPVTGKKILLKQFAFVFLLPVWFLIHGNYENLGLVPVSANIALFIKYELVSIAFFILSYFLIKDKSKTIVLTVALFFVYFGFGYYHDFLKDHFPGQLLSSYKFLLPVIFGLIALLAFYLNKRSIDHSGLVTFSKYLVVLLLCLDIVLLSASVARKKYRENNLVSNSVSLKTDPCNKPRPDIYFIVLDEYPSSVSLSEDLQFDNHSLDSLLKSNGFFISGRSNSNYNVTPFSLSSTFNLNYLKPGMDKELISSKLFMQAVQTFSNNEVVDYLQSQQYEIKNYGCFDLQARPTAVPSYFQDRYQSQIDNQTLYSRFMRDVSWQFRMKNIFTGKFRLPKSYFKSKQLHLHRNAYNWEQLLSEFSTDTAAGNKFVYVHLMLPHEAFYLNADGSFTSDSAVVTNSQNFRDAFINQVIYTNKLIAQLVEKINKSDNSKEKVIIIEGDHGYRFFETKDRLKEFRNLNAYYFSDRDYRLLYDSISPVNTFRVVLNKYFCNDLPLLKDSSIYLIHDK